MAGLGRTVLARHRLSRLWGLGDRTSPASKAPGLVLSSDEKMDVIWAPFSTSSDGSSIKHPSKGILMELKMTSVLLQALL